MPKKVTIQDKINKGQYGKLIRVNGKTREYTLRPPVMEELLKYYTIARVDTAAALYYGMSTLILEDVIYGKIPEEDLQMISEAIERFHIPISAEYHTDEENSEPNPLLVLLYKIMSFTGLTYTEAKELTPSQIMDHVKTMEYLTEENFYQPANSAIPQDQEERVRRSAEFYDKAIQKVIESRNTELSEEINTDKTEPTKSSFR